MNIREALTLYPHLPRFDREVLLSHTVGQDRVFLMAHGEMKLSTQELKRYRNFLARAAKFEPIAYIVGRKEFYGRDFFVRPGVLIPRPETEIMVEHMINRITTSFAPRKKIAVIDVGTGSGAIIESIFLSTQKDVQKNISWFAIDIEDAPLRAARKNAKHLGTHNIRFMKSDLLVRVSKRLSNYNEIFVAANLPYLSKALYRSTAPNVKRYEPRSALLSGTDGLEHYRRLMDELRTINAAGVKINFFLEISPEQTRKLPTLFADLSALSSLAVIPDLAGKSRLVIGVIENHQNKNPA